MNRKTKVILAAVVLSMIAGSASAGVTGTEFQALYTWLIGIVQGYGGRALAIGAIAMGALMSMAKVNPIPILAGVGFAIFLQYTPSMVTGILSATV